MARHLFIAQQTLSTWMDQDKITFDGNLMAIKADGRQFKLVEAVRFIKVEGGDVDVAGLIGKVKTREQLQCLGAERYRDSVIFDDVAYKVQEGFIGEVFLDRLDQEEEQQEPQEEDRQCGPGTTAASDKVSRPAEKSEAKERAESGQVDRGLSVAQTQRDMDPVSKLPPKLPTNPSSPVRAVKPALPKSLKDGKGDQKADDMSDEELLTQFLLDNL